MLNSSRNKILIASLVFVVFAIAALAAIVYILNTRSVSPDDTSASVQTFCVEEREAYTPCKDSEAENCIEAKLTYASCMSQLKCKDGENFTINQGKEECVQRQKTPVKRLSPGNPEKSED